MADEAVHDVVVFGAGPAGAAAALRAVQQGLRTVVVDRGRSHEQPPHLEWLHPEAVDQLKGAGFPIGKLSRGVIDRLRIVDRACARHVTAALGGRVAVAESNTLAAAMLDHARRRGANLLTAEVTGVEVQEQTVCLRMAAGSPVVGRVLLAADGYPSMVAEAMAPDRQIDAAQERGCRQVWFSEDGVGGGKVGRSGELTLFLESDDLGSFGYTLSAGGLRVVSLVTSSSAPDLQAEFAVMVERWAGAGLLVGGSGVCRRGPIARRVPRGVALEAETHVGKNALVIGDAGGYVSAVSHEGLYGAIRSAFIAAETCADALRSARPQDVLMEFDARWRRDMVDYLRMPNSDMRFLLPLVFSNERMAEHVAQAFVLGKNI